MNAYTISNQNGPLSSRGHNLRDAKAIKNQDHILPHGVHETWYDEDHRSAYKRIFGESVKEYNKNARCKSERISDYYNKIKQDKRKHTAYEVIITVGNCENRVDDETGKQIMKDFVEGWKDRNPNLEMVGAYYHADEYDPETGRFGAAHVHIDYIPVAKNCTRGPRTQNALSQALTQQGFVATSVKDTPVIKWQRSERLELERICRAHGISVVEKKRDSRHHLETDLYKKKMKAAEIGHQIDEMELKKADLQEEADNLELEIEDLLDSIDRANENLKKVQAASLTEEEISRIRPTYVGDRMEVDASDYASLKLTASESAEEKNKRIRAEEEAAIARASYEKLQAESAEMEQTLNDISGKFSMLGEYFHAYKGYVKAIDPGLDEEATRAAVAAHQNRNNLQSGVMDEER